MKIARYNASPANRIYIIDALVEGELKTGLSKFERVRDEVLMKMPDQSRYLDEQIFHRKCMSATHFLRIFDEIEGVGDEKTFPLIFIDGHGDKQRGFQLPSGDYVEWGSFNSRLTRITLAAHGNLTVIASFCNSMSSVENLGIKKPPPSPFFYGYDDVVKAGEVEIEGYAIIESLVRGQRFYETGKKLKLYSEYDHALQLLRPLIALSSGNNSALRLYPELSKGNLRKVIQNYIGERAGKTSGVSRVTSDFFKNHAWVRPISEMVTYKTERRERLIADVISLLTESGTSA